MVYLKIFALTFIVNAVCSMGVNNKAEDVSLDVESYHPVANKPYCIKKKCFIPNIKIKKYKAEGIASWYGKPFHGRKTSTGERYNMFAYTAASTVLPIPSYAKVTNLSNNKSLVVRINDRGPFVKNRILDLSFGAAHKLGFDKKGTEKVLVEWIRPSSISNNKKLLNVKKTNSVDKKTAHIQIAVFDNYYHVGKLLRKMPAEYKSLPIFVKKFNKGYQLVMGPLLVSQAQMIINNISENYNKAVLLV